MFAPEWEKVGGLYASSSVVQIGAVNCNQYKDVCVREGIHAYPAVKAHHVPLGEKSIVEIGIKGQKKVKSVVKWVEELLEQHNIESGADISTLVEENKLRRNEPDEAAAAATGETEGLDGDNYVDMKLKRLRDAGKATMLTLENSLFMGTPVLEGERYDAALMWVNALAKTLPMEGNRLAFVALANDMKQQTRWEPDEWSELLKKWRATAKKLSFPSDLFDANGDEEPGSQAPQWRQFDSM
ncbi:hypothetical protein BBP00_00001144 [Phytophthora kernoviae]|uniref:Thioredoxin domain-containing protein n=1 Tax=Phytophthora kernoviae TaxID=325452 RepID=A0A3F2S122_9STRA|nr:hypothetical protein BBP00_00001144 [Phytophthora kernoviae]